MEIRKLSESCNTSYQSHHRAVKGSAYSPNLEGTLKYEKIKLNVYMRGYS